MLAFSPSCERNKDPILEVLRNVLVDTRDILEVGSGTGQHAVYFSRQLPHIVWQTSDQAGYLPDIMQRIRQEGPENVRLPLSLDVRDDPWPDFAADAVFTANTLHIMSWNCVSHFFRGVGTVLKACGLLIVYGPFRYNAAFTTDSNAAFDRQLRQQDPLSGIRDFEAVNQLAAGQGLNLLKDCSMPANNQMLIWQKTQ